MFAIYYKKLAILQKIISEAIIPKNKFNFNIAYTDP